MIKAISYKKKCFLLFIVCTLSITGCGHEGGKAYLANDDQEQDQLEDDPALGLSVNAAEMTQRILVDRCGYKLDSDKKALFLGTIRTGAYEIRRSEDDEIVYSGMIKSTESSDGQESIGVADFSDFMEKGNYYIYVSHMGKSYPFSISDHIYNGDSSATFRFFYLKRCGISTSRDFAGDLAHAVCHSDDAALPDKGTKDVTGGWHLDNYYDRSVTEGSEIVSNLLLAYEINNSFFTDNENIPESGNDIPDLLDEVKYETDWMLKMQKEDGSVYESVLTDRKTTPTYNSGMTVQPATAEATIDFAAAQAKMAFNYRNFEDHYSDKCQAAAEKAWKQYNKSGGDMTISSVFNAAAELYRLTGKKEYSAVLMTFFKKSDFTDKMIKDTDLFYGAVTYLSCNEDVSTKICDSLMKALVSRSSDILNEVSLSGYSISADENCIDDDASLQQLILDIEFLVVTNHIVYNGKYIDAIENGVHYLLGRNPKSLDLIYSEDYSRINENGQMTMNSFLILFFSSL